jgi:Protein of unknown function (DUF1326)
MKHLFLTAGLVALTSVAALAGSRGTLSGEYVEARTAEVFAGGCVMNSEAETMGRQAVMAWRIDRGSYQGVSLDGLAVVAAVNGDRNLGMRELGGEAPQNVRAAFVVDARATDAQREALVAMARDFSNGVIQQVVSVTPAQITYWDDKDRIAVSAPDVQLTVNKQLKHDPSCGAMQWFRPLTTVQQGTLGVAEAHAFSGTTLGSRWSDPNKRSAFFAKFSY